MLQLIQQSKSFREIPEHNEILTVGRGQVLAVDIMAVMATVARIQDSIFQVAWDQGIITAIVPVFASGTIR